MKYPIGIQSFDRIREDGFVYVDKTAMIYSLVQEGSVYFLSRPRRFGKSLLVSTLACYFQGRKELFDGLAIANLEKDWLTYPIFRIDFNGGSYTQPGILEATIESYIANWEVEYGKNPLDTTISVRFRGVLKRAYEQTGQRAVVLIDEYDKPILDVLDTGAFLLDHAGEKRLLEDHHRELLAAFYSTFKGADEYLKFVLLTGVTKFSFSGFNQPKDISISDQYETLCGITQKELEDYFAEPMLQLADRYLCTPEEMKDWLKRQYSGYHFSRNMTDMYNPFSILNAFDMQEINDYWFTTGTPSYLIRLLQHSRKNINELAGKYYIPALFIDYKADVECPLPMIYQSGYFTIKEHNMRMGTYLLDFPNNEVREGFLALLPNNYSKPRSKDIINWTPDAAMDLKLGDTAAFRRSLNIFFSNIFYDTNASLKGFDLNEKYFQYTFCLLLRLLGAYCPAIHIKDHQRYNRIDFTLEMEDYIYIFEFKLDGTAREALEQIEKMGYAKPYVADKRTVIRIGVNFSSATRTVEDWEEIR